MDVRIFQKSNIPYLYIAAILILIYWIGSRFFSGKLKTHVENFEGYISDDVVYSDIPLDIYQTWKTKDLPPKMKECVETLRRKNPEFTHHLYDDEDCYEFIKRNFEPEVAEAYDSLIPGAYKADLWRYCILYKRGGVYLDIKYKNVGDFKLIDLMNQEHFVYDSTAYDNGKTVGGIYNAFIIAYAGNQKLKNCIDNIVKNVKNKYYGKSDLAPTGPILLGREFSESELSKLKITFSNQTSDIRLNGKPILEMYKDYYTKDNSINNTTRYGTLWIQRKIYK